MKNSISPVVRTSFFIIVLAITLLSCKKNQPRLKDVFSDDFLIGTCMNATQINGSDPKAKPFIAANFNTVTIENAMKWENVHPKPGKYDFAVADSIVKFAIANKMFVVGHVLVWHSQTPDWVFQDSLGSPLTREALISRMKEHIFTVVGHFKGRVNGWDVLNEAFNEDGSLRNTKWFEIIGKDYIQLAFEFANAADPGAELYYNDYNNELPAKREGIIPIIKDLKQKGIKIDGLGIQGHWHLDSPGLSVIDESISKYAALGLKVVITEMEVNVLPTPPEVYGADVSQQARYLETLNPYSSGLPDSVSNQLADRYADLFRVLVKHKGDVTRVTFWGVHDGYSWKNDWPIKGRTNYPLLFDRNYNPKPAFYSVIKTAKL